MIKRNSKGQFVKGAFGEDSYNWKGGRVKIICRHCGVEFKTWPYKIKEGKGKFCSNKCFGKYASDNKIFKGSNNGMWKDNNLGYGGIHMWLKSEYGSANKCESLTCKGKSIAFQWALLKGKEYERKRENFIMLCVPCHLKYDMANESSKKYEFIHKGLKLINKEHYVE